MSLNRTSISAFLPPKTTMYQVSSDGTESPWACRWFISARRRLAFRVCKVAVVAGSQTTAECPYRFEGLNSVEDLSRSHSPISARSLGTEVYHKNENQKSKDFVNKMISKLPSPCRMGGLRSETGFQACSFHSKDHDCLLTACESDLVVGSIYDIVAVAYWKGVKAWVF